MAIMMKEIFFFFIHCNIQIEENKKRSINYQILNELSL